MGVCGNLLGGVSFWELNVLLCEIRGDACSRESVDAYQSGVGKWA